MQTKIFSQIILIYSLLYLIGARILRFSRKACRHSKLFLQKRKWALRLKISDKQEQRRLFPKKSFYKKLKNIFAKAFKDFAETPSLNSLAPIGRLALNIANWIMPVAAIVILLQTAIYFGSLTYALRVEYNGEYVGYISNENDFISAKKQVQNRTIGGNYSRPQNDIPQYKFESIEPDQLTPLDLLANNMIAASGNEIQEAAGLYVDDSFMGAVEDGDSLLLELKGMKKEAQNAQSPAAQVSFVQGIRLSKGLYPVASVIPIPQIMDSLNAQKGKTITYIIKEGDSPYTIAQELDIPMQNIYDLNPEITKNMLIGDELIIQKSSPLLQKQVTETVTEQKEIFYAIEKEIDQNKESTYQKIEQAGHNGLKEIVSQIVTIDGVQAAREVIEENIITAAVNEKVVVGSLKKSLNNSADSSSGEFKNAASTNLDGFIWPVASHKVICSFYGYYNHNGVDIGAPKGASIWAAKSGTVAYANWSRGYGYNVLINHADGTKTRYAHCSSLLVSPGQQVAQGQQIAQIGRTGNASTEHCHFEIIKNGRFLDAQACI